MRITIYTRNDCVQCHATKRALESRGIAFDTINLDEQPEAIDTLRAGFSPVTGRDDRFPELEWFSPGHD